MAILDLIEYFDPSGNVFIYRQPFEGSGEIRLGSQLVVQESQVAFFFRDGQMLDAFGPGRHTLTTNNLPLLGRLIGAPFGGNSPFRAYVVFASTSIFTNLGWGTKTPVNFRDSELYSAKMLAHGAFSIKVKNPRTFILNMVGTRGKHTTWDIEEFLRSIIVSRFQEVLGSVLKTILDLSVEYQKIEFALKERVKDDFEQYGIQLVDFLVEAITPDAEAQKLLEQKAKLRTLKDDVGTYSAFAQADALKDMANNQGGGGAGMGAGLGIGAGMVLAQQMGQNLAPKPVAPTEMQPPLSLPVKIDGLTADALREKLSNLKVLKDEGLISDSDFDEKKRKLLEQL